MYLKPTITKVRHNSQFYPDRKPRISLAGYLDKQGSSVASFWRKRYVGCTKTELQYFSDKKYAHNKHAMKGVILIDHMMNIGKSRHSELIFAIDTKGLDGVSEGRQYRFAAQTAQECQEWINVLTSLVQKEDSRPKMIKSSTRLKLENREVFTDSHGNKNRVRRVDNGTILTQIWRDRL